MAIVTRYFASAASGTGDGTSVANAAALAPSGNWSTVITGFSFASNSLEVRVLPGTYAISSTLQASSWATPPTVANPIMLYGCDVAGSKLTPGNPAWTSDTPSFPSSGMPVLNLAAGVFMGEPDAIYQCLNVVGARTGGGLIASALGVNWCRVEQSGTLNTSTYGIDGAMAVRNCFVTGAGASAHGGLIRLGSGGHAFNCRCIGNPSSASALQAGIEFTALAAHSIDMCTIANVRGYGIYANVASTGFRVMVNRTVIVDILDWAFNTSSITSQTLMSHFTGCYISNAWGVLSSTNTRFNMAKCRVRNLGAGGMASFGNYPVDDVYTTAGTNADEFADHASGDYRMKAGSAVWGKGYGVSDASAASDPMQPKVVEVAA